MDFGQSDFTAPKKKRKIQLKSKFSKVMANLIVTLLFGLIYFYVTLPAINLHSPDFYVFIGLMCLVYVACSLITSGIQVEGGVHGYFSFVKKQCKFPAIILAVLVVVFVLGSVASMEIFRAGSYRDLITIEEGDFVKDVEEISFDKIPMLDEESAMRLGDRKLGELSDMVSQFEVADNYTQINYQNRPVRVTPLEYGDVIKWFKNRKQGIPAYLVIDMADQSVEVVRLSEGIRYSPSELFNRKLERHLRFSYPTFMFDEPTFEIDEDGRPYWVCPRIVKRIGLFGGTDIEGAVLMDAVTGESQYYDAGSIPTWVDRVYTADLIMEQYDYHGQYINGFINSIFGQTGVTVTTSGYNYIALNDDIYMYTGITSVGGDQSNIGFILSNQRTKETKYYPCAGAAEYSAMASAEGVVQHLGYTATFPLLLNISGQPTYFMALKDNAKLVKMYAMVNVAQYQIVGTGETVAACEQDYLKLLAQHNITENAPVSEAQAEGVLAEIRTAVKDGDSYYYLRLENESEYYVISASDSEIAVIVDVGDRVRIEFDQTAQGDILPAFTVTILSRAQGQVIPDIT